MQFSRPIVAFAVALLMSVVAVHQALAQSSVKTPEMVIRADLGGSVVQYARQVSILKRQPTRVRFAGRCDSACTLYLSLPQSKTCIEPGASFGFHLAYGASEQANIWATSYLLKKYPDWVRAWIAANGGLSSRLKHMSFDYAARHLQTC